MKDILTDIIENKRQEILLQKQAVSIEHLREQVETILAHRAEKPSPGDSAVNIPDNNRKMPQETIPPANLNNSVIPTKSRSMKRALAQSSTGIIAEFKRKSPSKGWIKESASPEIIIPGYQAAGASVLSILTDETFFGGSLRDIRVARPLVDIPILRKDFIIDEYQLLQACIVEADAILLIAACLSPDQCHDLTEKAHALGLEVLLEVHSPHELSYIDKNTDMVGVNNRNLGTFVTDIENSFRIAEGLKQTVNGIYEGSTSAETPLLVSESGISNPDTLLKLRSAGFKGFLIGETFMHTEQPEATLRDFIEKLK